MFGHVFVDYKINCKPSEIEGDKLSEKEVVDLPNEKVEEKASGRVLVDSTPQEVLVVANEEENKFLTGNQWEGSLVEASLGLLEKPLEVGSSFGIVEEGEIIDVDGGDPFPFLQCIEDLLKYPGDGGERGGMCGFRRSV